MFQNEAKFTLEDVAKVVDSIEKDWGVLTVQDVVWNHAAKNAGWLQVCFYYRSFLFAFLETSRIFLQLS